MGGEMRKIAAVLLSITIALPLGMSGCGAVSATNADKQDKAPEPVEEPAKQAETYTVHNEYDFEVPDGWNYDKELSTDDIVAFGLDEDGTRLAVLYNDYRYFNFRVKDEITAHEYDISTKTMKATKGKGKISDGKWIRPNDFECYAYQYTNTFKDGSKQVTKHVIVPLEGNESSLNVMLILPSDVEGHSDDAQAVAESIVSQL